MNKEHKNISIRKNLICAIAKEIGGRKISQAEVAEKLGVAQSRISDISRQNHEKFSIDALVNFAVALDMQVTFEITSGHFDSPTTRTITPDNEWNPEID